MKRPRRNIFHVATSTTPFLVSHKRNEHCTIVFNEMFFDRFVESFKSVEFLMNSNQWKSDTGITINTAVTSNNKIRIKSVNNRSDLIKNICFYYITFLGMRRSKNVSRRYLTLFLRKCIAIIRSIRIPYHIKINKQTYKKYITDNMITLY